MSMILRQVPTIFVMTFEEGYIQIMYTTSDAHDFRINLTALLCYSLNLFLLPHCFRQLSACTSENY